MDAVFALLGLIVGAGGVWWLQHAEITYLRKENAVAQDRLLHAWREPGVTIPPRPVEVKPIEALPLELQECVNEWENPEARAAEESRIRKMLDQGWGVQAILRARENEHP